MSPDQLKNVEAPTEHKTDNRSLVAVVGFFQVTRCEQSAVARYWPPTTPSFGLALCLCHILTLGAEYQGTEGHTKRDRRMNFVAPVALKSARFSGNRCCKTPCGLAPFFLH